MTIDKQLYEDIDSVQQNPQKDAACKRLLAHKVFLAWIMKTCLKEYQNCSVDEIIEQYKIKTGDFDTITECKYTIPNFMDIGKLYSIMIEHCAETGKEVDELLKIFSSFISDKISDFQTDIYYQNPSYLECSYEAGYLLD